jgi:predicted Zn finger-like uncharacterized protein
MNIACPECRSVFRVDPAKVPAGGVRARCSVCGGVITVSTELAERGNASGAPNASAGAVGGLAPAQAQSGGSPQFGAGSPPPAPGPRSPGGFPPAPAPRAPASPQVAAAPAAPVQPSRAAPTPLPPPRLTPSGQRPPAPPRPQTLPGLPPIPPPPGARPAAAAPAPPPPQPMRPMVRPATPPVGQPATPMHRPPVFGAPAGAPPAGAPSAAPRPAVSPAAPAPQRPGTIAPPTPIASPRPAAPSGPPARPVPPAAPGGAPPARAPINPFLANDPNAKAKRLARALVSDIVAYHPQKRDEGVRNNTLAQLFKEEIKKSYEEYVEQVGREFADGTTHFQDALNDVLAGGKKIFPPS